MIYRHEYFILDEAAERVFNRHGEEVELNGLPYKFLLCLCQREGGKVLGMEIDEFLDPKGERTFNNNQLRQYRAKIEDKLNFDLVRYDNEKYWIDGWIEKLEKMPPIAAINKKSKNKTVVILAVIFLLAIIGGVGWRINKTKFVAKPVEDMVVIPAGEFTMGSSEDEIKTGYDLCYKDDGVNCAKDDFYAEYPQHIVNVSEFSIDRKEVSNSDYQLFMQATNRKVPAYWSDTTLNQSNQPVVGVSWADASAYCAWLGKRLPMETEWEKAARGTDARIFSWGNDWDGAKLNHGAGGLPGYDESDGYKYSAPVGIQFGDISSYGVIDMSGNEHPEPSIR